MVKKMKIYGTRRRGHREKHYVKKEGRNRYFVVRRDSKGHFRYKKRWTPKEPLKAETYTETHPLILTYTTGGDALRKMKEAIRQWEWTKMEVES